MDESVETTSEERTAIGAMASIIAIVGTAEAMRMERMIKEGDAKLDIVRGTSAEAEVREALDLLKRTFMLLVEDLKNIGITPGPEKT